MFLLIKGACIGITQSLLYTLLDYPKISNTHGYLAYPCFFEKFSCWIKPKVIICRPQAGRYLRLRICQEGYVVGSFEGSLVPKCEAVTESFNMEGILR